MTHEHPPELGRSSPSRRPPHATGACALLISWVLVLTYLALTGRPADQPRAENPGPPAGTNHPAAAAHQEPPPPPPVSAAHLRELPEATTHTTLRAAPKDPGPARIPSGRVVHPRRTVALYAAPGGPAIAALPPTQLGGDTWLPVIGQRSGWLRVLLPTRPNGATAWLHHSTRHLRVAHSPHRIHVDRDRRRLTLYRHGQPARHWRVGVGKPEAPTPGGRTFLLAALRDHQSTFSPIVLPLGAHSDTHQSYGGGPGTVGIHTWPTSDVYGRASSDGCIRVPRDALTVISTTVPIGTPVLIR